MDDDGRRWSSEADGSADWSFFCESDDIVTFFFAFLTRQRLASVMGKSRKTREA
jgi:hypothetical protein